MKKLSVILLLVLSLMIVPFVSAIQPAQQYNKILLDPLYRQSMDPNTPYSYNITINPLDGISNVQSAIITFQIWLNPTIEFFIEVDGQTCNTPSFEVHTTYAGAGEGTIFFDCSNVITKAGTYNVTLTPDDDTGAITGWADITYSNNPKGTLELHGTEYTVNLDDTAKIWLQLLDANGSYVTDGVCWTDIYTPGGEEYIEKATMTNMFHDGVYYYDIVLPRAQGVYPAIARCYYTAVQPQMNFSSYNIVEGKLDRNDITKTWVLDGQSLDIKTDDILQPEFRLDVTFNNTNLYGNCSDVAEDLLTSLTLSWTGKWETDLFNHYLNISIWNYTDSSWVTFGNGVPGGAGGAWQTISNSFQTNNITTALGITSTNPVHVRFNDNNNTEGEKKFKTDYIYVSCDQLTGSEWQDVKGSSEIHVSSLDYYNAVLELGESTNKSFYEAFTFHYTVESYVQELIENASITLPLYTPFPCDHIINVSEHYENGTNRNMTFTGSTTDKKCNVETTLNLRVGENYDIEIRTENYWKRSIYEDYSILLLTTEMINISCTNYVYANNLTNFTIPFEVFPSGQDNFWFSCAAFLDKSYQYQELFTKSFLPMMNANFNATYEQMQELESHWLHLKDLEDSAYTYANLIFAGLNLGSSYSLALLSDPYPPANPNYSSYFAGISTSYLNYLSIQGVPGNVWSYSNRSLTNYSESAIANAVWTYSGAVGATLLNQIVAGVWDYTGTPVTTLLNNFTSSMWSFGNRSLTNYTPDVEAIWGYSNRSLTNYTQNDTATAETIWAYENRTVTGGNLTGNVSVDTSAIIIDIWNYTNRTITGQPQSWVGGTEYSPDETVGKIVVRLVDGTDEPVENAECLLKIFYPNNTLYLQMNMTYYVPPVNVTGAGGIYLADFNLSGETGVHPYGADCHIVTGPSPKHYYLLDTYHVYGANLTKTAEEVWKYSNRSLTNYSQESIAQTVWDYAGAIANTLAGNISENIWEYDGNISNITSKIWNYSGNRTVTDIINLSHSQVGGTEYIPGDIGKISIRLWRGNNPVTGGICDATILYPNESYFINADLMEAFGDGVYTQNFTVPNVEGVYVYFMDCIDGGNSYFGMDTFHVSANGTINYTKNSEFTWSYDNRSLTNYTQNDTAIADAVWSASNRSLTNYTDNITAIQEGVWSYSNRSLTNYTQNTTAIADAVWGYTGTIGANIITQVAQGIWEYSGVPSTSLLNNISFNTWNFATRNLTWYNMTDTTNYTKINDEVPELVWTYSDRTVTGGNITAGNVTINPDDVWNYSGEINSNITGQIVNETWNASARYTHGVIA